MLRLGYNNNNMNKDMKKLIAQLEAQGFAAVIRKTGHVIVVKDGVKVTTFSGTPSDHRGWKNSMSYLKRAGFKP